MPQFELHKPDVDALHNQNVNQLKLLYQSRSPCSFRHRKGDTEFGSVTLQLYMHDEVQCLCQGRDDGDQTKTTQQHGVHRLLRVV